MVYDGCCVHGIPADEGCVLCFDKKQSVGTTTKKPPKMERQVETDSVFAQDVERLVKVLTLNPEWMTSEFLNRTIGWTYHKGFSKTYIRHLAKGSRGRVISGQQGYKATLAANVEEVQEAAAVYMRAATGCMDRRSDILFVFHRGRTKTEKERAKGYATTKTETKGDGVQDDVRVDQRDEDEKARSSDRGEVSESVGGD